MNSKLAPIQKYTFNLSEVKKIKGSKGNGLDFDNINNGFYDEIEKTDIQIKKNRKTLRKIKSGTIKECVYSHRDIPDIWQNKIGYHRDVLQIFTEDEMFLSYVGRGGPVENEMINHDKNGANSLMSKTAFSNFPKEHSTDEANKNHNTSLSSPLEDFEQSANKTFTGKLKFIPGKGKYQMSDREIIGILDDFRTAFPIKDVPNEHHIRQEENKSQNINNQKNSTRAFNKTFTSSFHNGGFPKKTGGIGGIFQLHQIKLRDKQDMFRKSIFSKIIPPKRRTISTKQKKLQLEEEKSKYGPFLHFDYEAFNKKVEVANPLVKKYLETINFFGPYFSYCPPCRNRNMEFYKELDPAQCIDIIKCIKKTKRKNPLLKMQKQQ